MTATNDLRGAQNRPQNGDQITDYTAAKALPDRTILIGSDGRTWVVHPERNNKPRMLHAGAGLDPITLDGPAEAIAKFYEIAPFEILYIPL